MPPSAPVPVSQGPLTRGLPERRYRPELHGVRGLAILGVVLFHLFGNGRVSGGVDIFLAISGFLFTAMLLREMAENKGRFRSGAYFSRLFRRLVPPVLVVIAVTTALGLWILPASRQEQLLAEARASLLYFQNFELLQAQLSYEAAHAETSPFQHFWSLSVQGQFYLIWPVVVLLAVWVAKALKTPATYVMVFLTTGILAGSLAFAVHMQSVNQDQAYFMTQTRLWELALGALLALIAVKVPLPKVFRSVSGWLGIALIVSTGFILDGAEQFPGPWALWPLVGLALVLMSAHPDGPEKEPRHTAAGLLGTRPFAWLGGLAYGLYLWHWPLLIFYLEVRDYSHVGPRGATAILLVSLVLAWLSLRLIEQPSIRFGKVRVWKQLLVGVGGLTAAASVTTVMIMSANWLFAFEGVEAGTSGGVGVTVGG